LHTVKKIGGARDDLGRNTKRNRITERSFMCGSSPLGFRKASLCDVGESFNSNNIDIFSNIIAKKFAEYNKMFTIAGSDSHISCTLGRCINTMNESLWQTPSPCFLLMELQGLIMLMWVFVDTIISDRKCMLRLLIQKVRN
jgi:hypothetical protein